MPASRAGFHEDQPGLGEVGGLGELKRWLGERRRAYGDEARRFGERLAAAGTIHENIYELWIQRVNSARCEGNPGVAVCMNVGDAEAYKKDIVVDRTPGFVVVANKLNRACMIPSTKSELVNLTEGCNYSDKKWQFYWYGERKHLVHIATSKCVKVRDGSLKDGADIILGKCQGAKDTNGQWLLEKQGKLFQFKNVKSRKCITVTGELRSGRRLTQSNCATKPAKDLHWRLQMQ